jgi:hypothetical protein
MQAVEQRGGSDEVERRIDPGRDDLACCSCKGAVVDKDVVDAQVTEAVCTYGRCGSWR